MRMLSPSLALAVFGAAAIGFAAVHDEPSPFVAPHHDQSTCDHAHVGAQSCKPSAPLSITITASSVSQGVIRFDYAVTPTFAANRVVTSLEIPSNATQIEHRGIARAMNPEESFVGHGRVRLASGARGAKIRVRGSIEFDGVDDQGNPRIEIAETTTDLLVGDIEASTRAIPLPLIHSGSEPSLEVPAVRTGGSSR